MHRGRKWRQSFEVSNAIWVELKAWEEKERPGQLVVLSNWNQIILFRLTHWQEKDLQVFSSILSPSHFSSKATELMNHILVPRTPKGHQLTNVLIMKKQKALAKTQSWWGWKEVSSRMKPTWVILQYHRAIWRWALGLQGLAIQTQSPRAKGWWKTVQLYPKTSLIFFFLQQQLKNWSEAWRSSKLNW